MGTGYPGYTGIIPRAPPWSAETLRDNGYATAMFGKCAQHPRTGDQPGRSVRPLADRPGIRLLLRLQPGRDEPVLPGALPQHDAGARPEVPGAGLPLHRGHDRRGDRLDQQHPCRQSATSPGSATSAPARVHAPHHAPKEWRDKYLGKFDHGWDRQREITFEAAEEDRRHPDGCEADPAAQGNPGVGRPAGRRQEGLLPADGELRRLHGLHRLSHRPADRQPRSVRRARQHARHVYRRRQRRRAPRAGWKAPSTRSPAWSGSTRAGQHRQADRPDRRPGSEPHVPVGWAWAMDAPFQWTKQVASHFGGTRNPMVVHWPKGIKAKGEIRTQYHHVIDVVPTILEACKIPEPKVVNGIPQKPIEGVSMLYTSTTRTPTSRRTTQYFEMFANRGDLPRRLARLQPVRRAVEYRRPRGRLPQCSVGAVQPRRRLQPGRRPGQRRTRRR